MNSDPARTLPKMFVCYDRSVGLRDMEGRLRRALEQEPGLAAAWLFGSRARGTSRERSDVDVAILLTKDPPRTLDAVPAELAARLEKALGRGAPRLDVVVLNRASADLVHRVLRDGKLLGDSDRSARIRFEVKKRNEYFDLRPLLDRYRKPAVTDVDLVAKKLARIETCVRDLRSRVKPDDVARDIVAQRFAEHTLQIAIQAALDIGSHIVSDERLGEPERNSDVFERLAKAGWLPPDRVAVMVKMTGFRNVVVHEYDEVDLSILRDILEHRLDDLLAFVAGVRAKLPPP